MLAERFVTLRAQPVLVVIDRGAPLDPFEDLDGSVWAVGLMQDAREQHANASARFARGAWEPPMVIFLRFELLEQREQQELRLGVALLCQVAPGDLHGVLFALRERGRERFLRGAFGADARELDDRGGP